MGKTSKKKSKPYILSEKISKKVENALKNGVVKFRPNGAYCTLCQRNIKFDKSSDAVQEIHTHLTKQEHTKRLNKGGQEGKNNTKDRCGNCEGCQKPICNECKYCLDNQNEDGNKQRKRCLTQKCHGKIKTVAAENTRPSSKLSKKPTQGSSLGVFGGNDVVRWVLSAITSAICEHRWEDAATLLPAMILRHEGHITDDFMWRVIDTVSSNAQSIPDGTKNKLRRLMVKLRRSGQADSKHVRCGSMDMHEKVVLDSLAQELTKSSHVDDLKDEVQKLEHILEMGQNKGQRQDPAQSHVAALVIAYRGVFLYSKWKFLKMSIINKEANQERKLQDDTVSSSEEMNLSMWQSAHSVFGGQQDSIDSKVVGTEALHVLKTSLEKLKEPCEFALGPYLELQLEINGPEATLKVIEEYRKKYPDHLPGKKLLYYVLSEKLCSEKILQMEMLKEICYMCDQDPLVLTYVDQLIQIASTKENLSHFHEVTHDNPDSGLEDFSDNSADESEEEEKETKQMSQTYTSIGINNAENVCSLQPDGYVECLLLCVKLLCRFLEYPQFRNHLTAWQKLTLVLKRLHHAWLRCWYCSKCELSKKKIRVIRRKVNCLWKFIIWKPPTNDMLQEEAQILLNKAYAAHFFCFSEDYILQATAALVKSGYSYLAKELLGYINFSAPHTEKFKTYRNQRRASYAFHRRPTFGMNEIQQMFGITKVSNKQKKDDSITPSANKIESHRNKNKQPVIAVDGSCDIIEGESAQSDRVERENCSSDRIEVECDGYIETSKTQNESSTNAPPFDCKINDKGNDEKDESLCEGDQVFVVKTKKSQNMHIFSQFTNEMVQTSHHSPDATLKEKEDKGETLDMKAVEIKNFAIDARASLQKLEITLAEVVEKGQNNVKISGIHETSDLTKFFTYSHPIHIMEKIKQYLENIIAERKAEIKNYGTSQNAQSQDGLKDTTTHSSFNDSVNDSDLDDLPMPSQLYTENNVNPLQKIQSTEKETEGSKLFSESLLIDENLFVTSTQIPQKNNDSNVLVSNKLEKSANTNSSPLQSNNNKYKINVKAQNYDDKADESDGEYDDDSETDMEEFNMGFKPIGTIYPAGLSTKLGDTISDNEIISTKDENKGSDDFSISKKEHCAENIENNRSQDMCRVGPHASSGTVYMKQGQQLVLAGAVDVHHYENNYDASGISQCNDLPINSEMNQPVEYFKQPKSQLLGMKAVDDNIDDNEKINLSVELRGSSIRSRSESDLDMTVEEEQFDPYNIHTPLTTVTCALKSGFDVHSSDIQLPKSMYNDQFEINRKSNIHNKLSLSNRKKKIVSNKVEENVDNEILYNTQSSTITCGQRDQKSASTNKASSPSRNSSSGYKAGSSGEHEISLPVSQNLNDSSVFFQYTDLPSSPYLDLKEIPKYMESSENKQSCITSIPETQDLSQDYVNIQESDMKKISGTKPNFNSYAELSFIPGNEELDVLNNSLDTSIPITCGQRESFDTTPQVLDECVEDEKSSHKDLLLMLDNSSEMNSISNDEEFYSSKSVAASSDAVVISDSCSDSDISDNRLTHNHGYSALKGLRPYKSEIENDFCLDNASSQSQLEIEIVIQDDDNEKIKSNNKSKTRLNHTKVIGESNDPAIFDHSPVKPTKPFKVLKVQYPKELEDSSAKHTSEDETDDETDDELANKILENIKTLNDERNIQVIDNVDSNSDVFFTATEEEENLLPYTQISSKERENVELREAKEDKSFENTEDITSHIKVKNCDKNLENYDMNEQEANELSEKNKGNIKVNQSFSNELSKVLQTQTIDLVSQNIKKSQKNKKDIISVEEEAYKNKSIDEGKGNSRIQPTEYTADSKVKVKKSNKKNQDMLSLEEEVYKDSSLNVQEYTHKIKKKKKNKYKEQSPNKLEISLEKSPSKSKAIQISQIGYSLQAEENNLYKSDKSDIGKGISVSNKKEKRSKKSNKPDDLIIGENTKNNCIAKDDLNDTSSNKGIIYTVQKEDNKVRPKKKKKKDRLKNKGEILNDKEDVQGKCRAPNTNENFDKKKEKKNKEKNYYTELDKIDDQEKNYFIEETVKKSKKNLMNLNGDGFECETQEKLHKFNDKDIFNSNDIEETDKDGNEVVIKKSKKAKKKEKEKREKLLLVNNRDEEKSVTEAQFQSSAGGRNRKKSKDVSTSSIENYETCEEDQDLVEYINETNNVGNDKYLDKMESFIDKMNNLPDDNSNNEIMQGENTGENITKSTFSENTPTNEEVDNVRKRFDELKQKRKEKRDPSHSVGECSSFIETIEGVEVKAEITDVIDTVNDWLSDELFNIESGKIIGSGFDGNENVNKTFEIDSNSFTNDKDGIDINETNISRDNLLDVESETESFVKKIKKNKENKKIKKDKKKIRNEIVKNPINYDITNFLSTSNQGKGNLEDSLKTLNKKNKKKYKVSSEINDQIISKQVETKDESSTAKKENGENIVIAEIKDKQDEAKVKSTEKKSKKGKCMDLSEKEDNQEEITAESIEKKEKKRKNIVIAEIKDKQDESKVESTSKKVQKGKHTNLSEKDDNLDEITGGSISKKEKKKKNIVIPVSEDKRDETEIESKSKKAKKKQRMDLSEKDNNREEITCVSTSKKENKKKKIVLPESVDNQDETKIESTSKKAKKRKYTTMLEKEDKPLELTESTSKKGMKRKHINMPENEEKQIETADISSSKKGKKRKHNDMPEMKNKQIEFTSKSLSKKEKKRTNTSLEDLGKFTVNESERSNLNDEESNKKKRKKNDSMVQIPKSVINEYISPQKSIIQKKKLKKSKKSNKQRPSAKPDMSSDVEHLFSMPIKSLKNIVDQEKKNKLTLNKVSSKENNNNQNKKVLQDLQKSNESGSIIHENNNSKFSEDLDDLPFFSDDEITQLINSKDISNKKDKHIVIKKKNKYKKQICTLKDKKINVPGCYENIKTDTKSKLSQREEKNIKVDVTESGKTSRKSSTEDELNGTNLDKYFNDSDLDDLPYPDLAEEPEDKQNCQKINNYKKNRKKNLQDSCENRKSKEKDFVTPITETKSNTKNSKSRVARLRQDSFKEDLSPILPPPTARKHKLFSPEKTELFSATPPTASLSQ